MFLSCLEEETLQLFVRSPGVFAQRLETGGSKIDLVHLDRRHAAIRFCKSQGLLELKGSMWKMRTDVWRRDVEDARLHKRLV